MKLSPRHFVRKTERSGAVTIWWQPATRLRKHGFKSERLPDNLREAWARCAELNDALDRWRAGLPKPTVQRHARGTFTWLCDQFRASKEYRSRRATTRYDYDRHMRLLCELFGERPIAAFTPRLIYAYRQKMPSGRQGMYRMQVLRLLMGHAVRMGELPTNPASQMRLETPPARTALWLPEQRRAFLELAPPSVRLAFLLALYTGQREADVLSMRWTDIRDGWIQIVQQKTGRRVAIPLHSKLRAALAEAPKAGLCIVISERSGAPWRPDSFRGAVQRTSEAAGITGVKFMDLRRTAVTSLADAGCTVPEIAAITGHSVKDAQTILDTYLVATRQQAATAMRKLEGKR